MGKRTCIVGCGDVGYRIAKQYQLKAETKNDIFALVRSEESQRNLASKNIEASAIDFDEPDLLAAEISQINLEETEQLYYLVPPQKSAHTDERTKAFLNALKNTGFTQKSNSQKKVVLISTTGVYGDCEGEWITEETPINPTTERSKRRADMERQWQQFTQENNILLSVLRVPGIYSFSRLPRARLETKTPVVNPDECGYTNRIHADDLAMICYQVMQKQTQSDFYNVSDGNPSTISQYLMDVADFLNLARPEVVSLEEGYAKISTGMMSYVTESRKIDSMKLISRFNLQLSYLDYREGIRF